MKQAYRSYPGFAQTKKIVLTLIFLVFSLCVYSQKTTTVVFKYKKEPQPLDADKFQIFKPLKDNLYGGSYELPAKIIATTCKNDTCSTICRYTVQATTTAFLGDLFMHEIILIPGDSITVNIGAVNKTKLAGKYLRLWSHDVTYTGKNKYVYGLFDSLANFKGDLRMGSLIKYPLTATSPDSFSYEVKERYLQRIEFLTNYSKSYSIPSDIKQLVQAEIHSAYITNLISPLIYGQVKLNAYPKEFKKLIVNTKLKDSNLYFKTNLYNQLAYELSLIQTDTSKKMTHSNQDVITVYNWIAKNYAGKMRDHLTASHLLSSRGLYSTKANSLDSLLSDFKTKATDKSYIAYVDSNLTVARNKKVISYTIDQAMASAITDPADKNSSLQVLFKKKPVLVICWASWCVPCIAQIPYERELEKLYGDKIDFVYLSFDRSASAWKAKSEELKLAHNNYLLLDNFKSALAGLYKISSIPQYFIYDKEGKLVENKQLRPSDKAFGNVLAQLIN